MAENETGVVFPATGRAAARRRWAGRSWPTRCGRSTRSARGRPSAETNWRRDYRATSGGWSRPAAPAEAALPSPADGLDSLHDRMRVATADGEIGLAEARPPRAGRRRWRPRRSPAAARSSASSCCRTGAAAARRRPAPPARHLGRRAASSNRPAPRRSARAPTTHSGSRCPGAPVVVLGAGAEMGPLTALLRWGADVVAVDLPRPALWQRLLDTAHRYAGRLHVPVAGRAATTWRRAPARRRRPAARAAPGRGLAGATSTGRWCSATTCTPTARTQRPGDAPPSTRWPAPARPARRPDARLPRHADRRVRGPPEAVAEATRRVRRRRAASAGCAVRCGWSAAAGCSARNYAARRRPRHQRQPRAAAGPQLRAGQAAAAVAGGGRPGRRDAGVAARRAGDPDPQRGQEPGCSPRRSPARTGSASRSSNRPPATRSWPRCSCTTCTVDAPARGAPVAGGGVRGGARRAVAAAVLAAQRARHRRPARRRRRPLTPRRKQGSLINGFCRGRVPY